MSGGAPLDLLTVEDRAAWRRWLARHHAGEAGIWLVFYKKHTGRGGLDYEESVCEALCFGWVDSLLRRIDDDRCARKFTPRKPKSNWSESNLRRFAQMVAEGRMTAAGLALAPTLPPAQTAPPARGAAPEVPDYIAAALRSHGEAWTHFSRLPPSHRRLYVRWIEDAKRPETRLRRLAEAVGRLALNQKLGLK
jgi:uncharacterized protein YdeI (YjbR/CyaY-like superfamily)